MKFYPLFLSGREDFGIYVLILVYSSVCFRQGRFFGIYMLKKTSVPSVNQRSVCFVCVGTEETYKMVRMNARLIPTTEKSGLATPLWSDSEFKTLLGKKMDLIVTEKVRQELTQKYEIHPDKTCQ